MDISGQLERKKLNQILTKRLTRREVEILSLFASGFAVKEISEILIISESTIRTHINNIFLKVNIKAGADKTITLCLLYYLHRKEIMKMGGFKYAKCN